MVGGLVEVAILLRILWIKCSMSSRTKDKTKRFLPIKRSKVIDHVEYGMTVTYWIINHGNIYPE